MTHPLRSLLAATLFTALTTPVALAEQVAPAAASETTAPAAAPTADAVPTGTAVPTAPPVIGDTYHFALTGPEDKPVTDADAPFADKYLLVAFGFTSCPDVCPTTLYEFGEMLKKVKEPDVIQPVFISIDPLRDNSKVLNQYTNYFSPRIIGLTGDMPTIEATAKRFNATFGYRHQGKKVTPPDLPEGYTVYHSTMIYLLSPKREMIDVFDYQSGADKLARDIEKAIAKDRGDKA
ncbi:SCO family protein [Cardiobacterium sp. Marseille-Q4385]|uniref:SCO family protein n=1 Tax=Cardiobacterium sp. Marseille-Q4385 TaxID=2866573 RepID=UPI001CE43E2A|nr:SCO family protein [Cardiobacterium sp. Marseille-Q4385]